MTRARGRRLTDRQADLTEDPQARAVGASNRTQGVPSDIPGGRPHLLNAPTIRQDVPIPDAQPEIRGVNAHGVLPDSHTTRERAEFMRGPNDPKPIIPHYRHPDVQEPAVPVRIVEQASSTMRSAGLRHFALNATGTEPTRLCGIDPDRVEVLILNEDASSNVRFAHIPGALSGGGGALLMKSMTSYLRLGTQDELWAISADSGTPTVSVIQVFDKRI